MQTAAQAVPDVLPIDWQFYKSKLGDLNVDALQKDSEAYLHNIPAIPYISSSDEIAHKTKEKAWEGFAAYCASRIAELKRLSEDQADHKLHRWYRRRRVWQRFPGLYEKLHNQVRGTWDKELWGNYLSYKARAVALPWDPAHGDVTEEEKKKLIADMAAKSGIAESTIASAAKA